MPVAYMIASNGKEATLMHYFRLFKNRNPVLQKVVMTDCDIAQINAAESVWSPTIMLCWWHVLHAWQQHFSTSAHPELWSALQSWLRMTDKDEFEKTWEYIQSIAPKSVIEYLQGHWLTGEERGYDS
jgi:hypothetical protein